MLSTATPIPLAVPLVRFNGLKSEATETAAKSEPGMEYTTQRLANPDHRLWIRPSIRVALAILPLHQFCTLPALARQPRMLPAIFHHPHRFPAAQCSAQRTTGLAICGLNLPSDFGLLFWRPDMSHCYTFDGSPP